MSSGLKLNPTIAKDLNNGQIQCLICNTQVKSKIWTAHLNGRKHKESVAVLKEKLTAGPKRGASASGSAPPAKKTKDDEPEAPVSNSGGLPSDFFDMETDDSQPSIQTPWQKSKEEEKEALKSNPHMIEGVPQGFFDDKRKDNMVRETVERNAQFNEEYEKLMREVNEQTNEAEQKAEAEAAREARMRELEMIDEQLSELKKLNELEIRKEQILAQRKAKAKRQQVDDSDDDNNDEDLDFDNWRIKRIL